jgi:3-dehydroquinate synthase
VSEADNSIRVDLGPRSYEIQIVSHQLSHCAEVFERWWSDRNGMSSAFSEKGPSSGKSEPKDNSKLARPFALIITDQNIAATHAEAVRTSLIARQWRCETQILPAGETSKSLEILSQIFDRLIELNADRRTVIVAVGGGVVGDAAGFIAATYMRGLPFIQVPTTLLAAVDSSVGGKTGVNHPRAKNMIGAFYQPIGVFIDTATLETLPDREYRAGLAEVVKYGVILDAAFLTYLEQNVAGINSRDPNILRHIISESCRLKAQVVEEDEFETKGLRAALNYGHTFGHAFEALAGYGELLHGEAVAIGIVHASRLAERRGLIDRSLTERQISLLRSLHLPTRLPNELALSADDVLSRMRLDKKSVSGSLRFVLPIRAGAVQTFSDVAESDVRGTLADCLKE